MFKRFFIFFYLILIYQSSEAFAVSNYGESLSPIYYSTSLKDVMKTMQKLPEVNQLLIAIQEEGSIRILESADNPVSRQFGACWDPDNRIIFVNMIARSSRETVDGSIIGSILFELQNAAVNSQINHYDELAANRKIGKEDYVRAIEYLEFQNSLKASHLAERGIELGIFPVSARLMTYTHFEEHYYFQKISGHSDCIARNYDQLTLRAL